MGLQVLILFSLFQSSFFQVLGILNIQSFKLLYCIINVPGG